MMSELRFLTIHLLLLLLLLAAGCEAQDYSYATLSPEYENDYNTTFDYSFFSNSSSEDLYRFIDEVGGKDEEEEVVKVEEEVSATTETTSRKTTERINTGRGRSRGAAAGNSASLPVSLGSGKLLWTSVILMVLNLQQL